MPKTAALERWITQLHSSLDPEIKRIVKNESPEKAWAAWAGSIAVLAESCGLGNFISKTPAKPPRKDASDAFSLIDAAQILDFARRLTLDIKKFQPEEWLAECEMLLEIARDAAVISPEAHPLMHQMLAGELGWMLGLILGEWKPARDALAPARKEFTEGIERILDDGGLPESRHLHELRGLLACWTRALDLGNSLGTAPWKATAQRHFEWAVLQVLRLSRKDGTAVFSQIGFEPVSADEKRATTDFCAMIEKTLMYDTDPNDGLVALTVLPGKRTIAGKRREDIADCPLPEAAHHSDHAALAVMREDWSHDEPALFLAYGECGEDEENANECGKSGTKEETTKSQTPANQAEPFGGWSESTVRIELNTKNQTIWSGCWDVSVRINGRTLRPEKSAEGNTEPWTVNCDIFEPGHAYIELELPFEDGWLLQRHVFFSYDERLVLLADSLVRATPPKDGDKFRIEYESSIPLAPGIKAASEHEASELLLVAKRSASNQAGQSGKSSSSKSLARILPLGLPEWKQLESDGELVSEGCSVRLRMHIEGSGLFAPLAIDIDPSRLKSPYTWRRLTVGENLEVVPNDKAVGYRLQLANEQFLLYRSLTPVANRTILGHNLVNDFLFAEFDPENGVTAIIEVEENDD